MSKKVKIQTANLDKTYKALRDRKPTRETELRNSYPSSAVAHTGNVGTGNIRTASGVTYGQPQFFSPVHTPINWQIPSKRKEIYQWLRFYYMNEPKVASAIDFYCLFPINGFTLECKNRYVKRYYEKMTENLNLMKWLRVISHEAYLLGDCFPFTEISCDNCGGSGVTPQGEVCKHEGGEFKRIVVLNPDFVEVYSNPISPESVIALLPDEELVSLVAKKGPGYDKLSPKVRAMIASGKPIPLDNRNVSHIKFGDDGYNKYGISIVRRLFPVLAYKTKLMTAQWIVAERLILPIKVVKVGSETRPAGPQEIADIQAQLSQTSNDPNLTLVTHHAFDLEWYGACYSDDTEVLTENGWKKYDDVSKNHDEKIATYNINNDCIEYQTPQEYHQYEFNGELINFSSRGIDVMVTPNHDMLAQKYDQESKEYGQWGKIKAENITTYNHHFKASANWEGKIPEQLPYKDSQYLNHLSLDEYLKFVGFYLSEGGLKIYNGVINGLHISQSENSPCFEEIKSIVYKVANFKHVNEHIDNRKNFVNYQFGINHSDFAREIAPIYGKNSIEKKLPQWILNLPCDKLNILLKALMDGDGSTRQSPNGHQRYKYTTVSKTLANQIQEIVLKIGFASSISLNKSTMEKRNDIYIVNWSDLAKENDRTIIPSKHIKKVSYNGKVWCFTVPNGYFVTRRNGKISIHGNSGKILQVQPEYEHMDQEILDGLMINKALLNGEGPTYSNAAIGIEAMIDRLEAWRQEIKHWVEQKIFLPVAAMKGFVEKNEWGELEYVYPRLKWNIMHLRDQQNYRQFMLQMFEKGTISTKRLLETFDIDYDEEVELIRFERMTGQGLQQQPEGGAGGLGGGFGGGGAPGGGGDMGGLGELGGAPGGAPGGEAGGAAGMGAPAGGAPAPAQSSVANISQFGGKVMKKDKREKIQKQKEKLYKQYEQSQIPQGVMRDSNGRIMFTGPEREVMRELLRLRKDGTIKYSIYPQYDVKHGSSKYSIDFALPQIMLGIEVDGYLFHSSEEQKRTDKTRDANLASHGWTIIRFTDDEIDSKLRLVMESIISYINKKEKEIKSSNK